MGIDWKAAAVWLAVVRAAGFLPPSPNHSSSEIPAARIETAAPAPSPVSFLGFSDQDLRRQVESDPAALGTLSVGAPGSGVLINGEAFPDGPFWTLIQPGREFATAETIAFVREAIGKVNELYPETHALTIGDISDSSGGRLGRHITHQSGRDVDLGFYYKTGPTTWFATGTAANLDLPRNWALVRALLLCTEIETILLDYRIQRLLYSYALGIGEDKTWLGSVFQTAGAAKNPRVVHVSRHRTHYHVRFYNRTAQELGRRAYPFLVELKKIAPPVFTVPHYVRSGETLGHIAARYGTSVRAIQQANGLSGTLIRAGRSLRIPRRGSASPPAGPLVIPPRPYPPHTPPLLASVEWPAAAAPNDAVKEALARRLALFSGLPRRF